jgi:hypothetical protein
MRRALTRVFREQFQPVHQQIDDAQDERQADQARRRDGACELRHIVSDRQNKAPGALSEDQIDQHDRENADEAELNELPQKLFRVGHVGHEFAHGGTS